MDFSGRRLLVFCIQFSLVRQWIHVWRQSMRLLEEFHTILRVRHNAHHLRVVSAIRAWLWYVYGFGRPSLEREVQRNVCVHGSSCGAHRDVVHSPFEWLYHR